jgi:hypothetical protein
LRSFDSPRFLECLIIWDGGSKYNTSNSSVFLKTSITKPHPGIAEYDRRENKKWLPISDKFN